MRENAVRSRRHKLALLAATSLTIPACGGPTTPTPPVGPLTVTCPADVIVRGITGSSQIVTFPLPVFTGGKPAVNLVCTPASGATFQLGTTMVTCTVTDAAANRATCSFGVTLTPVVLAVTRFVAVGDSVTEGGNGRLMFNMDLVDAPNSYPTKLQRLLQTTYPDQGITVINRGTGGERVEATVSRLPGVLALDRPGALLLLDGYNNLLADCSFAAGVTAACASTIEFVTARLRDAVRIAHGPPYNVNYVFVATLTPPGPLRGPMDRRIAAAAIIQLDGAIRQRLPLEGAVVVDVYPLFLGHEAEYVAPDGLHLEPAGNQVLADLFFAAIRTTIPQMPSVQSPLWR